MEQNAEVSNHRDSDYSDVQECKNKAVPTEDTEKCTSPKTNVRINKNPVNIANHSQHARTKQQDVYYSDEDMCTDSVGSSDVYLKVKSPKKQRVTGRFACNNVSPFSEEKRVNKCLIDVPDYNLVGVDGGYQDAF
ncbi:unnamed protein product [Acanthoscelides obtectus]|uniref:Uncharacterized protein n=1 Tax=Acanthoscelides obtectus TaxID=200917 RepID=A0A9P0KKP0_ACAOB|nr:unnamed protein product [Acanthoscelides obtectus]CAH1972624.1 unnamed protein product [Acanthoscelides obtectus]CAK1639990.1 hypothetical protein AOBTE_LOCUS11487 [Acanthoscelides obtectus]CAK1639998.1 hypothetical protein AOBTE_LOCUS11493 [Acanthoscelides obtectus]